MVTCIKDITHCEWPSGHCIIYQEYSLQTIHLLISSGCSMGWYKWKISLKKKKKKASDLNIFFWKMVGSDFENLLHRWAVAHLWKNHSPDGYLKGPKGSNSGFSGNFTYLQRRRMKTSSKGTDNLWIRCINSFLSSVTNDV